MRLHRAAIFSPVAADRATMLADGGLLVDDTGRIAAIGPYADVSAAHPDATVTEWPDCALLPGLVDVHSHIPQLSVIAMDGYELLPWLERFIYPAEAAFADPSLARRRSARFFQAALARGTTCASLYATVHEEATHQSFMAARESGIRAHIGKVMMDRNAPAELLETTEASLAASERLCGEWHGAAEGRLRYVFSPRFAITCSAGLMRGAQQLADASGALIQTHLAENPDELRAVADLFPGAGSYTEVYADAGLLGPRTIVAHCLYLSKPEWDLLAETNTRVAHCPGSNLFLRSGVMDLREPTVRGITVGLGSDVGAGPALSMFAEMTHACLASRARTALRRETHARIGGLREEFLDLHGGEGLLAWVTDDLELLDDEVAVGPNRALYMATLAGARALGREDEVGSLEPGKWADFVAVRLSDVDPHHGEVERTPAETLSQIVFRTETRAVAATFVGGRQVHPTP